ncbi:MAG: FAD-dependent thymidylate synthase [Pseudomonadota bacterium]
MNDPKVYILSRPVLDKAALESFLKDNDVSWLPSKNATDAEHICEISGRICYLSFTDDSEKIHHPNDQYLRHIIKQGHESVLEHVSWTFIIDRVSRAFSHQLVRHRVGFSYSQLSQQYHDEQDAEFVEPIGLDEDGQKIWENYVSMAKSTYKKLLERTDAKDKPSKERLRQIRSAARSVLPNATETKLSVTANARALRHFFITRGTIIGDLEMRVVACKLHEALVKEAPALFGDIKVQMWNDGHPIIQL